MVAECDGAEERGATREVTTRTATVPEKLSEKLNRIHFFFFQAEDGIRDGTVTGVQTCALPICRRPRLRHRLLDRHRHLHRRRAAHRPALPLRTPRPRRPHQHRARLTTARPQPRPKQRAPFPPGRSWSWASPAQVKRSAPPCRATW